MSQNNQFYPTTKAELEEAARVYCERKEEKIKEAARVYCERKEEKIKEAIRAYRESKEGKLYDENEREIIQRNDRLITIMERLLKSFQEVDKDITKWDVSSVEKQTEM